MDHKTPLCSMEVSNMTGRRSATECAEVISNTLGRQILVESVIKNQTKYPQPASNNEKRKEATDGTTYTVSNQSKDTTFETTDNISISKTSTEHSEFSAKTIETHKQIENAVPQQWTSPMIVALTVASDKPFSQMELQISATGKNEAASRDTFQQIPTKKSTSAFASALAIAPSEPFNPVSPITTCDPVPLPEETTPYLPPERPFLPELKPKQKEDEKPASPFVQALKTIPEQSEATVNKCVKKKKPKEDELLKDLPKPSEPISLLAALTTAPDRPYSPLMYVASETVEKQTEVKTEVKEKKVPKLPPILEKPFRPVLPKIFPPVAEDLERPPAHFPPASDNLKSYQTSTNSIEVKSEKSQFSEEQRFEKQVFSESITKNEIAEKHDYLKETCEETYITCDNIKEDMSKYNTKLQSGKVLTKKVLDKSQSSPEIQLATGSTEIAHGSNISSNEVNLKNSRIPIAISPPKITTIDTEVTEYVNEQINEEKNSAEMKAEVSYCSTTQYLSCPTKVPITTVQSHGFNKNMSHTSFQPVIEENANEFNNNNNTHTFHATFQPAAEEPPVNTTFSPRPRSLTPSMINKPPPIIPYYQASLAPMQCYAPEINVFDPNNPKTSRSPSPCPLRSRSPFHTSSLSERPKSPAQGPPPNPLAPNPEVYVDQKKVQQARANLSNLLPLYQQKDKMKSLNTAGYQAQCTASEVTKQCDIQCDSSQKFQAKTIQINEHKQLHEQNRSAQQTVQTSADASVQIQRTTTVTEEYDRTCNSKLVQIETSSDKKTIHPFQRVNVPSDDKPGIIGLRVANPQPLKSPFISAETSCTVKVPANSNGQQQSQKPFVHQSISNSCTISKPQLSAIPSTSVSKATNPSSESNVRPNVSLPNAGSSGGRQSGAIGIAPRRGRGVLNLAGGTGPRVPLCGQCHSQIRGPFITALGKIWCPDHFICATPTCRRPLHDLGFVEEQGMLYCEYCFERYIAPTCAKCNSKIKLDCLKAIGKHYHPECFNCVYCGKLFGNNPFFLEDGQPYCDADWNELFTTKCYACGFPVEAGDRWVEALSNNYHSQCFNCTMCKKNLEGQSFFAKGGRPFCKNHAR